MRTFGFSADGPGAGLYSGAKDRSVRVWDPATAVCSASVPMEADVGALLLTSGWLFVGTAAGAVHAWNMATNARHALAGHAGQVQALAAALERALVFSGGVDATVRAWRFNAATAQFEAAGVLTGHTAMVTSLLVFGKLLFSGSTDGSVRVWDLDTAACVFGVAAHAGGVITLLLWEAHLLSGGLDGKIRVWQIGDAAATPSPGAPAPQLLECLFTHPDQAPAEDGAGGSPGGAFLPPPGARAGRAAGAPPDDTRVLAMCGTVNAAAEPILVASYDDCSLRFFALPSFEARGRMTLRFPIRALSAVTAGVLVGGDQEGLIKVWQWQAPGAVASPPVPQQQQQQQQYSSGGGGGGGGGGRGGGGYGGNRRRS